MSSRDVLARALLRSHTVPAVVTLLNNTISGEKTSFDVVYRIRAAMVAEGSLSPLDKVGPRGLDPEDPGIPAHEKTEQNYAARMGCERLHEAMQALYRKTASRLGCSEEAATLVLNYSPAQLAKRVAR